MIRFTKPSLEEKSVNEIWVQSEDIGAIFYMGWKFEIFRHWSSLKSNCWLVLYQRPCNDEEEGIRDEQPVEMAFHYTDLEEPVDICKEIHQYISYEIIA